MKKYSIGWGLTNCCNMKCKFCYSKDARCRINEAKLEDWIKFVDENYEMIDSINYGTGENSMLNEFFTFINYVRTKYPDIKQSVTTNGFLYERISKNPEYYEIYKKCIDEVDVSLDFFEKEKHNEFRGQPKAYDWAINMLQQLKKDNKKSTIVFVGFDETVEEENIKGLFKIANENNAYIRLNIYRPTSKCDEINKKFTLSYKKLLYLIKYVYENYKILALNDMLIGNLFTDDEIVDNTGINSIRILPNGNIFPSTYLISDEYLTNKSIYDEEVLKEIEFEEFENPIIPKECDNCVIKDKCRGGVYDRRYLWYNTLEERDPYCPERHGEQVVRKLYKTHKKERISVHDGYLPTMFFENK